MSRTDPWALGTGPLEPIAATPGPWHTDGDTVWAGTASPGICVTVMPPEGVHFVARPDLERRANARLIATSPRLYDFVKTLAQQGDANAAALIASI